MSGWRAIPVPIQSAKAIGFHDIWEMIASDNFVDNSNWSFLLDDNTASAVWTAASNQLTSPTGQTKDSLATFKGVKLNDGRAQVIYENPDIGLAAISWAGLVVRGNSGRDYLAAIIFNNTKTVELWTLSNAVNTQIVAVSLTGNDVALATSTPVSLEIEIIGLTVNIYVNGRQMITSQHASIKNYLYGSVGLAAHFDRAHILSNFSVRKKKFDVIPPTIKTIICVGTSITFGIGTTYNWPSRFSDNLNLKFASQPVTVINGGVSGDTSTQMLARLPGLISANPPDLVVIETSINDTRIDVGSIPFSTSISNLRQMIKLAKQAGAIPMLTTATPIDPTINTASYNSTSWPKVHQLNIRVRQLAYEENVRLIENFNAFNNNLTLINTDKLHPTDAGAQVMADTAINAVIGKL